MTNNNSVQNILSTVASKIDFTKPIMVAFSGGVDSTVLLHALVSLKQQKAVNVPLTAIYIHHGISKNADAWASHCQKQCDTWQVPLVIEKVTLNLAQGNIEEQARNARYQAIAKHLAPDCVLCTAQHLDDQSETFFLALKRGSGPKGLSAMPEVATFGRNCLIRPLLTLSRQQIEEYASALNLSWVEDESNQDDHYDRNFLRLKVLPILNQRWAHFNEMVARSAELCQQQEQLLDELLIDEFNQLIAVDKSIAIPPFFNFSENRRNALLRMWFKFHEVPMPSRKQMTLIWLTVFNAKEDANPQFILNNKQLRRFQNRLYLLPIFVDLQQVNLMWNLADSLSLPDNLGTLLPIYDKTDCRLPNKDEKVTVRFVAQGHFRIVGRIGSRSIKKLWQELNIPPWLRTRIPLVYYNDTLITAVGVFVTQEGAGCEVSFTLKV
ncbi:tRNA lysidine(34) synthetase TilS [Orbaceae bacterium ac157xtp]